VTRALPALAALVALVSTLPATDARAHWCDDNWDSAYNIVVRPEVDSVDVPDSGSAELRVWVQNNMTYPLYNFMLSADAAGYTIDISTAVPKRSGWLMPGEKLLHVLTITRSGGDPTMLVEDMELFVGFGDNQDGRYGAGTGRDVMMRKTDGSLYPTRPVGDLPELYMDQGLHLRAAAETDFGDPALGVDALLWDFCIGRPSWDGSSVNTGSYCPDQQTTNCPSADDWANLGGEPYAYLYMHLLSAGELAARKSALTSDQLTLLRERLMCAGQDPHPSMKAFTLFVLGYLGADDTARTYLEAIVASGAPEEVCMARAALLMMGEGQESDVRGCLAQGSEFAEMACGAALGVVVGDDQAVEDELFARVEWVIFESNHSGVMSGVYANLVAWHQRGWQPSAGDLGAVSFYEGGPLDTVPPRAPTGAACSVVNGNLRLTWEQVTEDESGAPEVVPGYNVYWGETARPGGATRPGEGGFDYDHRDPRAVTWFEPSGLSAGTTYYLTVSALDARSNESAYSSEVPCVAPAQANPPVAVVQCTPTDGNAPLQVTCDASGSSDPDGAATIASVVFTTQGQTYATSPMTHTFNDPGTYTVLLTVTDDTSREDTDDQAITVRDPTGQNVPPVAVAFADPTSGYLPLEVTFTSTGSSDSDGSIASHSWDFGDGGTSTEANPSHTFDLAGTYDVVLTVTDDGSPALSGVDYVTITVIENQPPDLSAATATPLFGEVPLTVQFDASGVFDPDFDDFSVAWAFGDGDGAASAVATHTYSVEGSFEAILTGTDVFGAVASRSFFISPGAASSNRPPELAAATVSPLAGPAPLTVQVDAAGCSDPDGDGFTIEWIMSTGAAQTEGEILTDAVASYTFTEPGAYSATLRATDDGFPPMQSTRRFDVSVGEPGAGDGDSAGGAGVGAGCACTTRPGAEGSAAIALILVLLWRRRSTR